MRVDIAKAPSFWRQPYRPDGPKSGKLRGSGGWPPLKSIVTPRFGAARYRIGEKCIVDLYKACRQAPRPLNQFQRIAVERRCQASRQRTGRINTLYLCVLRGFAALRRNLYVCFAICRIYILTVIHCRLVYFGISVLQLLFSVASRCVAMSLREIGFVGAST